MKKINAFRKLYAEMVLGNGNVSSENKRLLKAFSKIKREDFLGPGPWNIFTPLRYVTTPTDDVELIYQDFLVALDEGAGINNGLPSLHARCIDALKISKGESIAHVGAGTGYYSAILAQMTGEAGHVTAFEIDSTLVDNAIKNLSQFKNIELIGESGVGDEFPSTDVIYVSAGATHPAAGWLDKLKMNGRLVFPLTAENNGGAMVHLQKINDNHFNMKFVCRAMFIPCVGLRDPDIGFRLSEAFGSGNLSRVKSLRTNSAPDASSCFVTKHWWLSTE